MHPSRRSITLKLTNSTLDRFVIRTVRIGGSGARWVEGEDAPAPSWVHLPPGPNTPVAPRPGAVIALFDYLTWEAETEDDSADLAGEISLSWPGRADEAVRIEFAMRPFLETVCVCEAADSLEATVQKAVNGRSDRALFNITLMPA
jgi:hypothetical protein